MRIRKRKTVKLARLLVELDRASAGGRIRRVAHGTGRVSLRVS